MKMPEPTTTAASIAVVAALVTGVVAGRATAPNAAVKALEAQTAAMAMLSEGNQALVAEVNAVALSDAESQAAIADKLTNVPPQCMSVLGGDPMSPECAWAWCVRTGSTDKQRCQDTKLMDFLIVRFQAQAVACPDEVE